MRLESKKVLIVLTDGHSGGSTLNQAQIVHDDPRNIQVISIGVGTGVNQNELNGIATSHDQVFQLEDFGVFDDVKELISDTVCNAPIVTGESDSISFLTVSAATYVDQLDGYVPGKTTIHLTMVGRRQIRIKSTGVLDVYSSYSHNTPSPAVHDFTTNLTTLNIDVVLAIESTEVFYIALYNFGDESASVELEIMSNNSTAGGFEIPTPIECGTNAACNNGSCECNPGYFGDPLTSCIFDSCAATDCEGHGATCKVDEHNIAFCDCDDHYNFINGACHHELCPVETVKAYQNQFGYAMGSISSPHFGNGTYPSNFGCTYSVTVPKSAGVCFEVVLTSPFGIETSPLCIADRLEILDVINSDLVTMDRPNGDAVFCGNGKYALMNCSFVKYFNQIMLENFTTFFTKILNWHNDF